MCLELVDEALNHRLVFGLGGLRPPKILNVQYCSIRK